MIIGCPVERKHDEGRVGLAPAGALELVKAGHTVLIEKDAGKKAHFTDEDYVQQGAEIVASAEELYGRSEMIVKVKEPQPDEWKLVKSGQILFCYFHFCASQSLTEAMLNSGAICISYETVQKDGRLPLLEPMSEVAGRMSIQCGMHFLETPQGGAGVMLSGLPGVRRGRVLILGGGVVGASAASAAAGVGADVVILDKNVDRLRMLASIMPPNVSTRCAGEEALLEELSLCDLLVGAVLLPGRKAPKIVRREHLKRMKPGSVIVDVSIDHGGCVETTRVTCHHDPIYEVDGIIHYGVANMPAAVAHSSTLALTNVTLPYVLHLAERGWLHACLADTSLMLGLNVAKGKVLHPGVAEAFGLNSVPLSEFLERAQANENEKRVDGPNETRNA
ncbi:alanine dehydrogenase [Toxoplasma gondii TgCatPRC2]|uniref:alanine dehydrogenase n=15 Tax=Toxoplasma gondii TaxID=5811 RepID=B9PJ23_TOXGV|nr:alanine dehydrogenase [Toxoplasma gondii ME49]EPR58901.1 alanine dehydrogenase [Toxoplasma gondii GT1]ESS35369.1 alanine dehydrogenase [Toxoplasma gondii VEG]KAF4639640.1 alanine dehydrogenase [Toxoplasma gondii]KFG36864.1 alanine dehydrogenase [Toxoplasma gondii GAB2-2007-GAL-DOM2]KFG49572.1 alanine dehydrogenase [Toxoplasma gondii p89]KFG56324.1 alanine dehydrogenase [Toxoplasma gondii FOU]KFG66329.1 alanine dehydrogenase [Toxoplasma gondii RUB]KFH02124.1 alanine dehydrogenase [Toxopla|eukprot:XP_002364705.1 alanine dehydrogenase [Toxoplasma gondii ME49]